MAAPRTRAVGAGGRADGAQLGYRFLGQALTPPCFSTLEELVGKVNARMQVAVAQDRLADGFGVEPAELLIAHRLPHRDDRGESGVGASRRICEGRARSALHLSVVKLVDVAGRGRSLCRRFGQPIPQALAPVGDVKHRHARRPARGRLRLCRGLRRKRFFEILLLLQQQKHVFHTLPSRRDFGIESQVPALRRKAIPASISRITRFARKDVISEESYSPRSISMLDLTTATTSPNRLTTWSRTTTESPNAGCASAGAGSLIDVAPLASSGSHGYFRSGRGFPSTQRRNPLRQAACQRPILHLAVRRPCTRTV